MKKLIMSAAIAAAMIAVPAQAKMAKSAKCPVVSQANVDALFTDFNDGQ